MGIPEVMMRDEYPFLNIHYAQKLGKYRNIVPTSDKPGE